KGYNFAEMSPSEFHGISKFNVYNGESQTGSDSFSGVFGSKICELAEKDSRICAITAAMALGTGLEEFSSKYKDRFFDVGIAEEHAVTFASGLAKGGMKPVVAVYSTFLQRAYDQLIHDISLQKSDVVIAVDRAGFVGEDGITHQGLFDVPMLNTVPGIDIYSPCSYEQLKSDLETAINTDGPVAVRYPRGCEENLPDSIKNNTDDYTVLGKSKKCIIVSYGSEVAECFKAFDKLEKDVSLLVLNRIKPVSFEEIKGLTNYKNIVFCEESEKSGGIGENMAEYLALIGYKGNFIHKAVNDEYAKHASVKRLREIYGLDAESIIKIITELI
nr:1-deoxy-D-xylulose-5-phosphate synthase [Clostridiales bacterium]